MKLFIKNMVCQRCKMAVQDVLNKHNIAFQSIELGEVTLNKNLPNEQKEELNTALLKIGFELLDDQKSKTIAKIKQLIIQLIQEQNGELKIKLSDYLSSSLNQDYSALSNLFSEVENTTIEQYFIHQKVEKAKELITYKELTLSQIAYQLNYSSVAHLSNQFKKITGFSPSFYKQLKDKKRKQIDLL